MNTPPTHTHTSPEGKPIPTELRGDEAQLRKEIELEDDNTAVPRSHIDDEYAHAGEADPKVLLTTSRDPSSRLIQFAKVSVQIPTPPQHSRQAGAAAGQCSCCTISCMEVLCWQHGLFGVGMWP